MRKFVLRGMQSYKLPLTKRIVEEGIPFTCGEQESTLIKRYGHFIEVDDNHVEPNEEEDLLASFAPASKTAKMIPADWTGRSILLKCYGGIGDCLMAASIIATLKTKPCHVTYAVGDNALAFCEQLADPDEVVSIPKTNAVGYTERYDVSVDCTGYALCGPKTIIDMDFYEACYKKLPFNPPHEIRKMPKFKLPRQTNNVRSRLRMSRTHMHNLIAVHVDPTALHRKWPLHNWNLVFNVLGEVGKKVMLLGAPLDYFDKHPHVMNCTDMDVLDQLQIAETCPLFIGVDSCWAHIAGLMDKPGLVLFAPSVPENLISHYHKMKPIQPGGKVCKHRNWHSHDQGEEICECISDIQPQDVLNELRHSFINDLRKLDYSQKPEFQEMAVDKLKRKEKVAFIFPHLILGGGETSSLELCKHLQKFFDLTILATNTYKPERNIIGPLSELGAKFVKTSGDIASYVKDMDAVLWYGMNTLVVDALRNLKHRPTSIRVVHTHFKQEAEGFTAKYSKYIDDIVCVSPVKAKQMNSFHITNPVNTDILDRIERKFQPGKVMGYIGRLDDNKNIKWLVKNVTATDHDLIIQGIDEVYNQDHLKKWIKELGIEDRVSLYSGDVDNFYRDVDVVILPSKMEAMPMVVLEAGYLGIPTIATDVGGTRSFMGELVRTIDIEDGEPSLFDFKQAIKDYHKIDSDALKKHVRSKCTGMAVAEQFRAVVRQSWGRTFPGNFQDKCFELWRAEGIGDVLMSTAYVNRLLETFPRAHINFYTSDKCLRTLTQAFTGRRVSVQSISRKPRTATEISYNNSWQREIHAVEGMGGTIHEIQLRQPRVSKSKRRYPRIGIMPYMNKGARKKIKEWPRQRWVKLVSELRKEGYALHQLGHTSDELVTRLKDSRADTLEGLIENFASMDYIISIEGLACHIGKGLNKPIMVIQGNSSRHWHTSYELHDHVMSNSDCFCFASIKPEYAKPCQIECMTSISVKRVLSEFREHTWKLNKQMVE